MTSTVTEHGEGRATPAGVAFPYADGRRSTAAVGRAVVADALREVDPAGALAAEQETNWRAGYLTHFRRLVEAGLTSPDAAVRIADGGLASLRARMVVVDGAGEEHPLADWPHDADAGPADGLRTSVVRGTDAPETELSLPWHGDRLRGDDLRRRLDAWVEGGWSSRPCARPSRR
ncbi:hypothetical protein ACFP3Q_14640 [Nocardioides sp. GCM10027113]|uniref:hypothetical protein n=1 Tax=unclassified Nocardioides TaxID=2615069 RepID=UPI00360BB9C3